MAPIPRNVRDPGKHTFSNKRDVTFVVESSLVPPWWMAPIPRNVRDPGKHTFSNKRDVTFVVESSLVPPWWMAPIPRLNGNRYRPWGGCAHLAVSPLACGAHEHDHHCDTA